MAFPSIIGGAAYGALADITAPDVVATVEPILFLSSREIDRATLSASSAVATLPASFLQSIDVDRKWRTTGKVGQYLDIALARPVACDAVAIAGHNFTSAAVMRVRGALTLAEIVSSPLVDTGWLSAWPSSGKPADEDWPSFSSLLRWDNDIEMSCWRIEFADTGTSTTYLEMGRVWVGRSFQPESRVDQNVGIGFDSPDAQARTPFGKTFTDPRGAPSRRFVLPFSAVNESDLLEFFFELARYSGLARDFFCVIDPAETTHFHRYAMQAAFVSTAQFEAQPLFDNSNRCWRQTLTLTELI